MLQGALAPAGGTHGWTMDIIFTNREAKIRSINWNLRVMQTGTANNIPLETLLVLGYNVVLGALTKLIGRPINVVGAAPGVMVGNGQQIYLYKPGQYQFDCFDLKSHVDFNFTIVNNDPAINYTYQSSFIFETEEV
jgi:hypothetical protein